MPGFAVATATVMLVAQLVGQADFQTVEADEADLLAISWTMLLVALLIFAFGQPPTHLYTKDSGAVTASLSVILFTFGCTYDSRNSHLHGCLARIGNAKLPLCYDCWYMVDSHCGGLLLGVTLGLGLLGVWTATFWTIPFAGFLQIIYQRK